MLRYFFAFAVLVHGLVHVIGFAKAFGYGRFSQLTKNISKPAGLLWLSAALLFLLAAVLLLLKKETWWTAGLAAVVVSQVLILPHWTAARFGTVANLLVLLGAALSLGSWQFESEYKKDLRENLQRTAALPADLLTEADLQHLPAPVQRYLRYAGVLNKPKVKNFSVQFQGQMRSQQREWFSFASEQHNFLDKPTRLFFMKAKMYGTIVPGYHAYKDGVASMRIKLFGLLPVVTESGHLLNKAETVTLFNDMCLLAPATLIDKRISWQVIDDSSAKAQFSVNENRIAATLHFNEKGELVNFVSDDRYDVNERKTFRFSTPLRNYQTVNGHRLATYGEAVWHYPDGAFAYGRFRLQSVRYNADEGW